MSKAYEAKDPEQLLRYNGWDTIVTARAFARMQSEMTDKRQQALYEHNLQLSNLAARMHTVGFPVHHENRAFMDFALEQQYREAESALLERVAIPGFRSTPNDMRAILFKRHEKPTLNMFGLPDPFDERQWASKETISVDFTSLLLLVTNPGYPQAMKEIIDLYWKAEELKKARSTFIRSELIDQAIGPDGRLRPGWNCLGTDTGRWSCSKPNIQTLPQYLRHMYGTKPGRVLVHADFRQLELWVMAAVSGDAQLLANLSTGDVYTQDGILWFGLPKHLTKCECKGKCSRPDLHIKKDARQKAKVIHLAKQYGAGDKTVHMQALADDRTFTFKLTQMLSKGFNSVYSGTLDYWQDELDRIAATGYSETRIMGRRKVFPRMPERSQGVNFPVQGTGADVANLWILEVDRRVESELKNAHVVHQFHDAGDVECDEDDAEKVSAIMKDASQREYLINGKYWKFEMDIKVSNNWADL